MAQYQRRQFTCGPDSLHNAVNFLYGDLAPSAQEFEDAVRKDGALDPKGTSEYDLKRALRKYEIPHAPVSCRSAAGARDRLVKALSAGRAIVIYGRERLHWFVVVGMSGPDFIILDGAHEDMVLRWPWPKLAIEWRGTGAAAGTMYSIEIWKP